ncbi:hypothetical protein ACIBF6_41280 [Streptosporangium amethystogenes]|uniref:hypothetical protein n=1 Tax=Streptosporangium amethystogenes TaxID=2002 RepID=UPI0037B6CDA1
MPERTVAAASRPGLHARPARIFVEAVIRQGVPVRIGVGGGKPVPAGGTLAVRWP